MESDQTNIEAIRAQEQMIEREIADRIPYVSQKVPISVLKTDYQIDDDVYQKKITKLENDYEWIRRTRPDGNCFFRAFSFAYFESLINDNDEVGKFIKFTQQSKEELVQLGLPQFTIEDFYEVFLDVVTRIKDKIIDSPDKLLQVFYEQATSDYIVVYFRLITSGYLQKNADTFSNFIVGDMSVLDFCKTEVEPMFKESDHIHVVAITSALQVCSRIIYMDRGSADTVNAHDFPEQDPPKKPRIHLLYRPGHYDVLYVKS